MKTKAFSQTPQSNLPVSKQTAGGVAGAVVGSVIGGPVGAVVGAIAGTMMGNRAAAGKTLVSSETVKRAKQAVTAVEKKLPSLKASLAAGASKGRTLKNKPATGQVEPAKPATSRKQKPAKSGPRKSR
jgi:uncharacterized protein YcfJ